MKCDEFRCPKLFVLAFHSLFNFWHPTVFVVFQSSREKLSALLKKLFIEIWSVLFYCRSRICKTDYTLGIEAICYLFFGKWLVFSSIEASTIYREVLLSEEEWPKDSTTIVALAFMFSLITYRLITWRPRHFLPNSFRNKWHISLLYAIDDSSNRLFTPKPSILKGAKTYIPKRSKCSFVFRPRSVRKISGWANIIVSAGKQ